MSSWKFSDRKNTSDLCSYHLFRFLNWIWLTLWTICSFRVMNPHQWSLAKLWNKLKSLKVMYEQAEAKRDGIINPQNITISNNFNTGNFDALKRYESTQVDRRTRLHVKNTICVCGWFFERFKKGRTHPARAYIYNLVRHQMRITVRTCSHGWNTICARHADDFLDFSR